MQLDLIFKTLILAFTKFILSSKHGKKSKHNSKQSNKCTQIILGRWLNINVDLFKQ